jgi:DNA repair protein RecO (recombination protein O)
MNRKERIFVLKTFKYGESDLVVHGLNMRGARMSFLAKGGLKSRKRFAGGVLEPTHYIEVTFKERFSNESDPLHTLLEAQLLREFAKLRTDYSRLELSLRMLQLVNKLGQAGVVDSPDLFNLLGNALQAAETSENLEQLKLQFELKLLASQGVLPHEPEFTPWLEVNLGKHEEIQCEPQIRNWISGQVHAHLDHYLGGINL